MQRQPVTPNPVKNRKVAFLSVLFVAAMVGLAYASVPLYRMFCQVTGYGGTTQRAEHAPAEAGERIITVHFNADIAGTNLPWNATIVPGGSVRIGFNGGLTGANPAPTEFTLNGARCSAVINPPGAL